LPRVGGRPAPHVRHRVSAITLALLAISLVLATQTTWYVVFKLLHDGAGVECVGGLFIAMCAIVAELASDDDHARAGACLSCASTSR
jgi:hypothetical protein